MTSPLAWLAGLSRGATSLGTDIGNRDLLHEKQGREDALLKLAQQRQEQQDMLDLVTKIAPMGGSVVQGNQNPLDVLSQTTAFNNMASGRSAEGNTESAIPNSALGIDESAIPNAFGSPSLTRIGNQSVVFDPSKSREAGVERRVSLAQAGQDRREREKERAASDLQNQKDKAKTVSAITAARSNYETLKALNPKHPLVSKAFDADAAANYKDALDFEQAQQLQRSAYHPEQRAHYGSFIDPKNPSAPPVFIPEDEASRLGLIPAGKPGSGTGAGQNIQARLIGAVSEGRLADERMTPFEEKHLKGGKLDIGTMKQVGGNLATGLAGSHSPVNIAIQGIAEGNMNNADPEYLQYMRDARLIARAEQLMSARGGSEAMASDNAFLARGGANAPEATVQAARKSRRALFGKLGAVIQTLTPDQLAKLQTGLDALKNDDPNFDYGKLGQEVFGAGGVSVTPGGGKAGGGGAASKYGVPVVRP